MKKILLPALLAIVLFSCKKDDNLPPVEIPVPDFGLLVLNEGFYGHSNTSSITLYDFETESVSEECVFFSKNQRRLGDVPNDILVYGGKIYISVGISSTIEITDLELNSIKQISLDGSSINAEEPKGLAAHNGKIYIVCYDGKLARLDTSTLTIAPNDIIQVGKNPENVAISNGFAYVTNSGGMDFPNYDNTVSVVNLATFTEVEKIEVDVNPFAIHADETGHIIVSCLGNYSTIPASLHRINTTTNTYDKKFEGVTPADFAMKGNLAYYHDFNWFTFEGHYAEFNTTTETKRNLLSKSDMDEILIPYAINVNRENGDIYASCSVTEKAFIIDSNGIRTEFKTGAMPKKIVVLKK